MKEHVRMVSQELIDKLDQARELAEELNELDDSDNNQAHGRLDELIYSGDWNYPLVQYPLLQNQLPGYWIVVNLQLPDERLQPEQIGFIKANTGCDVFGDYNAETPMFGDGYAQANTNAESARLAVFNATDRVNPVTQNFQGTPANSAYQQFSRDRSVHVASVIYDKTGQKITVVGIRAKNWAAVDEWINSHPNRVNK